MKQFAFIHGSSVGQSVFVPTGAPESICNDIADKYFQGRTLRQKESSSKFSLFVDLYKSKDGNVFCVYSFVNNACSGANDRDGQYFALSIVCKEIYVCPEAIYRMMYSAYSQMFKAGRIIKTNERGEDQYVVSQFVEEKEYLSAFCNKIEEYFYNISNGLGKPIGSDVHTADYDSWLGVKVEVDVCNSMKALNSLCKIGRLYISEEYESASQKVKILEERVSGLEAEKAKLESICAEAKRSEKNKNSEEIENLHQQIKEKEAEIESLSIENKRYKTTIEVVNGELDKYSKIGKSIHKIQEKKEVYQSKGKKDLLKVCLLFIILIVTLISSLMNYAFFRNISPLTEKNSPLTKVSETKNEVTQGSTEGNVETHITTSLTVSPNKIEAEAGGGEYTISIEANKEWAFSPSSVDWVEINKSDASQITVKVKQNDSKNDRNFTFTINSADKEEYITITQKGKTVEAEKVEYGVVVKDASGKPLKNGDTVKNGDILTVTVTNPRMEKEGFGWKYFNCSGSSKDNVREVKVTVKAENNKDIIISYGDIRENGYREKFRLKHKSPQSENKTEKVKDAGASSNTAG